MPAHAEVANQPDEERAMAHSARMDLPPAARARQRRDRDGQTRCHCPGVPRTCGHRLPRPAARPGSKGWPTDVCVPISRLAECIAETKEDLAQSTIPSALAGHVGDGNFHLIFMIDPQKPEEIAEASRLNDRMVARALAMEGTCTGEHGIGYGKMDFMVAEHGPALDVMRSIKQALDPNGIMNPGKIVRI